MNIFRKSLVSGFKSLRKIGGFAFANTKVQVQTQPVNNALAVIPKLVRKPDELLIKSWWSETPFDKSKPLTMPIFSFKTGEYSGNNIDLDHSIFNQPLRRDLIHRVYEWRKVLFYKTTHIARTKGTTSGSGKKPMQQKGTGRARQGNLRAPGRWKGGKAHGPKPRDHQYPLCKKVRLMALKALLSANLAEGKIRIVDNEALDEAKTKILNKIIVKYGENIRIIIVSSYTPDQKLLLASQNLKNLSISKPNRLNVIKLLKCDKLIITIDGLKQMTQDILDRSSNLFRNRRVKRNNFESETQRRIAKGIKLEENTQPKYDPTKPLKFKFKILEDYWNEYEKKKETPKTKEEETKIEERQKEKTN